VERLLRPLSEVRPGEGPRALLMLASLLLLMVSYYVLKTVREPLILLHGGAELRSYAAGAQVLALFAWVPLYGWLTRRFGRVGLIAGLNGIFLVTLQLFYLGARTGMAHVGFAFFAWLGLFSVSAVSQFWSVANDLYARESGERLFPIIAIGAAVGSPLGSWIAGRLFASKVEPATMIQIACALLVGHAALALWLARSPVEPSASPRDAPERQGGFGMVLGRPYLRLIALLLIVLNVVNTTGEFILAKMVQLAASTAPDGVAFVGSFYGSFYTKVNLLSTVLQALVVSRIVKHLGMRGVVLMLPIVALGTYGLAATGVSLAVLSWLKTAENATDYSVMNTGRALLWLPTTREEKYRAKQTVDTFFVRFGDLATSGLVFVGASLSGQPTRFAAFNVLLIVAWLAIAWRLLARHRALGRPDADDPAAARAG